MIRVIAVCLFRREGRILVNEGVDPHSDLRFARPLGGGVEPGETSRQAVVREIREELGQDALDLYLLGVLENLFTYAGKPKHEIVFVYDGRLADESLYARPFLPMQEAHDALEAAWRPLDSFGDACRLVPEGLAALLTNPALAS